MYPNREVESKLPVHEIDEIIDNKKTLFGNNLVL